MGADRCSESVACEEWFCRNGPPCVEWASDACDLRTLERDCGVHPDCTWFHGRCVMHLQQTPSLAWILAAAYLVPMALLLWILRGLLARGRALDEEDTKKGTLTVG